MSTTKPTAEEIFPGYVKWMNDYMVLKTLILTSLFHTEQNKTPQISIKIFPNANMWFTLVFFDPFKFVWGCFFWGGGASNFYAI